MENNSNVFKKNELVSNRLANKITITTLVTFLICWVLNLLDIFLFDDFHMNLAAGIGVPCLVIPIIANKFLNKDDGRKKYIFIIGAMLFLVTINSLLAHHSLIMFLFPMLMAGLYFNKKFANSLTMLP